MRAALRRMRNKLCLHVRDRIRFIQAYLAWLWQPSYVWLTLLGGAVVPLAVLIWWPDATVIRYAGLGLQLLGIGTVWWGIRETRKLFEHPGFWAQAGAWLRRRPPYSKRVYGEGVGATAVMTGGARGQVWSNAKLDASVEDRLGVLEKNLERVREGLEQMRSTIDSKSNELDAAITKEKLAREGADREFQETLRAAKTGGLHITAMGAWWLLVGVTMGTIPNDIANIGEALSQTVL